MQVFILDLEEQIPQHFKHEKFKLYGGNITKHSNKMH